MADLKTTLRELSVIVGLAKSVQKIPYSGQPKAFIDICKSKLPKIPDYQYSEIARLPSFNFEQKQIIENGFNLSNAIINKFGIRSINEINWYGFDTQKDEPYDISVNNLKFSLKEESFILENMGLYKLLNCYTGSSYRTRHIFSDYARKQYEQWFSVTWNELLNVLNNSGGIWFYENTAKKKKGIIKADGNNITLTYYQNGKLVANSVLPKSCTLATYENNTTSKTREEVFAKFINMNLDSNVRYNVAKKECAIAATNALAQELNTKLNYHAGLPRFLRIHNSEYYYAKTTVAGVEIYKVPALKDFEHNIVIESIVPSVPDKQANILTTIKNIKTGKRLILRNECRFSHGQFNGTPEAKMYYENGGSLLTIYESI